MNNPYAASKATPDPWYTEPGRHCNGLEWAFTNPEALTRAQRETVAGWCTDCPVYAACDEDDRHYHDLPGAVRGTIQAGRF